MLFTVVVVVVVYCCYLQCCCSVTSQMFAIILVLGVSKLLGLVNIPNPSWDQFKRVRPSHYTVTFKMEVITHIIALSYNGFLHHRYFPSRYFTLQISFLAWEALRV